MKGRWHGEPFRDYQKQKWLLTFEVEEVPLVFESTKGKDLRIEITEYKNKRSKEANDYFYVLVNKIAIKLNISDVDVHDKLLSENLCYIYKDGALDWKVSNSEANKYRLLRIGKDYYYDSLRRVRMLTEDGKVLRDQNGNEIYNTIFWHIKGSHQMNTKEMARLIDSTVQEAKQLGIETKTPDELRRMKEQWGV